MEAIGACLLYCILSPLATVVNKFILSKRDPLTSVLSLPFTVTFIQQLICYILISLHQLIQYADLVRNLSRYNALKFRDLNDAKTAVWYKGLKYWKETSLGPTLFGLQILCSNVCLKYVDVGSYQVARSSSAIVGVVHEAISRKRMPPLMIVISCFLISLGFLLLIIDKWIPLIVSDYDSDMCPTIWIQLRNQTCVKGILLGFLASIAGVCAMAESKEMFNRTYKSLNKNRALTHQKMIKLQQQYLLIFYPFLILLFTNEFDELKNILMYCAECWPADAGETLRDVFNSLKDIFEPHHGTNYSSCGSNGGHTGRWWMVDVRDILTQLSASCDLQPFHTHIDLGYDFALITVSALIVVLMPFCTNLALESLSPLTLTVVGYVKMCLQYCVGAILFKEQMNPLGQVGMVICFSGCVLYSIAK